jgi:tetratricopeptide (TPR) repeat protein
MSMGEHELAIADLDQAIQFVPDDPEIYFNRGTAYYMSGDGDHAIADLSQAIQLDPNDDNSYAARGKVYETRGDTQKAIADFKKILEISGDPEIRQLAEEQLRALGVSD